MSSRHFFDELVQGFQLFFAGSFISYQVVAGTVVEQRPELPDEAVYAVDTVRIPGLGLFYRAEEHLIHTQRIPHRISLQSYRD